MIVDYLVTGGAGFIGSALFKRLLASSGGASPTLLAVDSLHPQVHPHGRRPSALPQDVDLRVFDVTDKGSWAELLRDVRPKVLVHLAAETGTGQSLDEPSRHTHVNGTGTACMLEALSESDAMPEHILLASSRAVYGEGLYRDPVTGKPFSPGPRTRKQLLAGDFSVRAPSGEKASPLPQNQASTVPNPSSVYAASKLLQEHLLGAWCMARGVPLTVLRLQNVYGEGQSPTNPYTGIMGLFHQKAARGAAIDIFEDGEIGRDFVHVEDVVDAFMSAFDRVPTEKRVLDVGTGTVTTIADAARHIADLYQAPTPQITGAFRFGDVRWTVCDASDLQKELGVRAAIDFSEGNLRLSKWLHATGVISRAAVPHGKIKESQAGA